MLKFRSVPLFSILAASGWSTVALAQEAPEAGFNAHGFVLTAYDGDARDLLTVQRPGRFNQGEYWFGGLFEYADAPLVYVTEDGETPFLDDIVALNLQVGVAAHDRIRLDAALPLFLSSEGLAGNQGVDLSDIRLGAMVALVRPADDEDGGGFGLGFTPTLDIPMGDDTQFVGNSGFAGGLKLAATYELSKLTLSADLGAQFNPAIELENLGGSDSLLAGLGVGYLFDPMTGINVEGHFSPPFSEAQAGDNTTEDVAGTASPSEILLSFRKRTASGFHFTLGGAKSISRGAGAAPYRIFLGAGYGQIGEPTPKDTDLDGIVDKLDACPEQPETRNAYQDEDGCPDRLGKVFISVSYDGAPWPQAEVDVTGDDSFSRVSTNEPFSFDAMPSSHWVASARYGSCLTGDGAIQATEDDVQLDLELQITEAATVAYRVTEKGVGPVEGATVTYTSEADECLPKGPLSTNDQGKGAHKVGSGKHFVVVQADGYAIHRQSLTVSAGENQLVEVELKPTKIKLEEKKIVILEKVYFETAKAVIKPVSFELLDEVATTLVTNPQIGKVEVSGHTDSRGSDSYNLKLSDDRAKAVLEYLTNRGVKAERLVAQGYGETKPIASNRTDSGRAQNRRVEFTILGEHASRAALQAAEGGESNE